MSTLLQFFIWSPNKVEREILAVRASVVKFPLTCIKPFHPLFPLGITLPIQSVAGENNSVSTIWGQQIRPATYLGGSPECLAEAEGERERRPARWLGPRMQRGIVALIKTFSDYYFGKPSGNPQSICMLIEVIYQSRILGKALHNKNISLIWY